MREQLTDAQIQFLRKVGEGMKTPPQRSPSRKVMYELLDDDLLDLVVGRLYPTEAGRAALRKAKDDA